jgi:hypothetical protein
MTYYNGGLMAGESYFGDFPGSYRQSIHIFLFFYLNKSFFFFFGPAGILFLQVQ